MTTPQQIIQLKRDGKVLNRDQIASFAQGSSGKGEWQDYQLSAMLMAIYFQGMTTEETSNLCQQMMDSGDKITVPEGLIAGDKHSTGGVGDGVSLVLAPVMAALGVTLPMISGRGLGHTGGTLDKLESIPGFNVSVDLKDLVCQLKSVGAVIAGQTGEFCPSDKKLYALRDVTATVDSIPLIACSIMAKKMCEGIDFLVLDVKFGKAAFMPEIERSRALARAMVDLGKGMGKKVKAVMTNMDEPLGSCIGNAVEVAEAFDILKGKVTSQRYLDVTYKLGEEMLFMCGKAKTSSEARALMDGVLKDGSALAKMKAIIQAQGGDVRAVDDYSVMPVAKFQIPVTSKQDGFIAEVDPIKMAYAAFDLGAGRVKAGDAIDLAVGISNVIKVGTRVKIGDVLCLLHANNETQSQSVIAKVQDAVKIVASEKDVHQQPLILDIVQ
jgi:pyrimidine-nucleoside phosphorylase